MDQYRPARCHIAWRTRCVWLVAFALFWGWLAPPFAQAFKPAGGGWVQVCTSLGIRFVQIDPDEGISASQDAASQNGSSAPSALHSTDCPYCCAHTLLGLVPTVVQTPVLPRPVYAPPPLTTHVEQPAPPPWRPALPRAPPRTAHA